MPHLQLSLPSIRREPHTHAATRGGLPNDHISQEDRFLLAPEMNVEDIIRRLTPRTSVLARWRCFDAGKQRNLRIPPRSVWEIHARVKADVDARATIQKLTCGAISRPSGMERGPASRLESEDTSSSLVGERPSR